MTVLVLVVLTLFKDTLTACTAVLLHWASALSQFSSHETTIRESMKAVRTREETLEEMKRKRKSLQSSADSADRKLSKMNAENKNFQSQADALNKLREEIRFLDTDIMNEEASLGDFKRTSAKSWMGTKFGALMECCEKGAVSLYPHPMCDNTDIKFDVDCGRVWQTHHRCEYVLHAVLSCLHDEVGNSSYPFGTWPSKTILYGSCAHGTAGRRNAACCERGRILTRPQP